MDDGSPRPSRAPIWARWGRRVAVAALAVLFLPPLLVRGALVRWIVARATRDLCGTIRVDDARLGWLVVVDLLRGRPFSVEVHGFRVTGPEGDEVMRLASVTTQAEITRHPWRFVLEGGVASRGQWRVAVDPVGRLGGLLGAFRAVPGGVSRAVCLQPMQAQRHVPRAPTAPSASLELRRIRLDEVDVDLDFPAWGLFLPRVHALGSLAIGTPGGAGFTFDVRDATAAGGALRAGPPATVATTIAHFDDAVISHVGISPEEPSDIVLDVTRADTGRSRLQGTALFKDVFVRHGARGDRSPPGLVLDARWDRVTDAAARLDAGWLPRPALGELLDGSLTARVRGPFLALSGSLAVEGPRVGITATIAEGRRASLDARVTDLALEPFLHASLQPLLRGRITGRLRVDVALLAGLRDVEVDIPSADVTLTRADAVPRRLVFQVGPGVKAGEQRVATDTLTLGLASASLRRRVLRLDGIIARWAEVSAHGALTLVMPREGDPEPAARVDAALTANLPSIARWVPPDRVDVHASAALTLTGPIDRLRARVAFARSAEASILGQRFRVPAPITATFDDGRGIELDGLVLERVGGGRLTAHGRAGRDGRVEGAMRLTGYPLKEVPGMQSVVLPTALGDGRALTLHQAVAGQLTASMRVAGLMTRPTFDGRVDLANVSLSGRRIGDGSVTVHARGLSMNGEGRLGPSLVIEMGAVLRDDGASADAQLSVNKLPITEWLPPALAGLELSISGTGRVSVAPDRPFATHATFEASGPGGKLAIESTTSDDAAAATAHGRVELAGLRPLWGRALADAQGAIAVDVTSTPEARLKGTLTVARAVSVRPRGWPVTLGVDEGGRVDVDETHLHVPGMTLTAPGARLALAGDVNADLHEPDRTTIDLKAAARLVAGALARRVRVPALASASGTITLDARAEGTVARPAGTATAHLAGVELHPAAKTWPAVRVDGDVDASARDVSTRGLHVAILGPAPVAGEVTVGGAATPASAELASAIPLRLEHVDVPVSARGLRVGDRASAFEIGALDLDLRLVGDPQRALVLSGDVGISDARFNPFGKKKGAKGSSRPWFESLPPWLTLDLTVHGPKDALTVNVPVLPDVDLGLRCRITGGRRGAHVAGEVRGSDLYSRFMISVFGPKGTRECQVLK